MGPFLLYPQQDFANLHFKTDFLATLRARPPNTWRGNLDLLPVPFALLPFFIAYRGKGVCVMGLKGGSAPNNI